MVLGCWFSLFSLDSHEDCIDAYTHIHTNTHTHLSYFYAIINIENYCASIPFHFLSHYQKNTPLLPLICVLLWSRPEFGKMYSHSLSLPHMDTYLVESLMIFRLNYSRKEDRRLRENLYTDLCMNFFELPSYFLWVVETRNYQYTYFSNSSVINKFQQISISNLHFAFICNILK